MSDKTNADPTQVAGQPPAEGDQQQFLTRAEYLAGQEQLLADLKKSNSGLVGSMGEMVGKRVSTDVVSTIRTDLKQLEKHFELQKAAGVEVTPEQQATMRNAVLLDGIQQEPEKIEPTEGQTPGQAPAQAPEQAQDPITQAAWSMMEERKVEILDEDPEAKTLDTSSPYKFLLSLDKAITAKETRLQKEPPPEEEQTTGSPQGRIPGAGAGGATGSLLPDGTPPMERLNSYYKKT